LLEYKILNLGTNSNKDSRTNQFQKMRYQRTTVPFVNMCFGGFLDLTGRNYTSKNISGAG
jgi:hypothetical protein